MNPFAIARPGSFDEAGALLGDDRFALPVIKAGGMDVVDLMKEGLLEPDLLVDVKRIRDRGAPAGGIGRSNDGIRIEATTTLSELATSRLLLESAPVVSQAVASAATPQVRNVATAAGNLLQRPRCWYFRNEQFDCLKKGGDRCYAVSGENRYHAIFGDGPCHIVHPSNLAVALAVCSGAVHVGGEDARRRIAIGDLYHMPDRGIRDEHELGETDVITHLSVDDAPLSGFYAVKEKQSFDWPLVMAAAALELDGRRIAAARICAGAVAPIPWPLPAVEQALEGTSIDDDEALRRACAVAAEGAVPMSGNGYKVTLLPVAVRRAVLRAAGRGEEQPT